MIQKWPIMTSIFDALVASWHVSMAVEIRNNLVVVDTLGAGPTTRSADQIRNCWICIPLGADQICNELSHDSTGRPQWPAPGPLKCWTLGVGFIFRLFDNRIPPIFPSTQIQWRPIVHIWFHISLRGDGVHTPVVIERERVGRFRVRKRGKRPRRERRIHRQ